MDAIYKNVTQSEPLGYYFVWTGWTYNVNDLVLVCLNDMVYENVLHRLGLPYIKNECQHNTPFLLKRIVAISGDEVLITNDGVYINNRYYNNSKQLLQYHNINLLPQFKRRFILKKNEFFLLGDTPTSYDSRYFGVIKQSQIYKKTLLLKGVHS